MKEMERGGGGGMKVGERADDTFAFVVITIFQCIHIYNVCVCM